MLMKRGYAIIYFLLDSVSILANSVFVYYVALLLLNEENGGVLCSLVLGMDAFFEIAIGPFLAKFIDRVPNLKTRLQHSLSLQISLMVFTFLFAWFNPQHPALMIIPLTLIRFFSLVDLQLKSALPLYLDKKGILPLTQSLSLYVFSQRFVLLLSSSLALIFLSFSWFFSCSLNGLTYISAIFALLLILKRIKSDNLTLQQEENSFETSHPMDGHKKAWIKWNYLFGFLLSIAFGSVALILTKCMLVVEDVPLYFRILQGPAPIYAGMFFALVLMMVIPAKINQLTHNGRQLCNVCFILAIGLMMAAFSPFYLKVPIFFILGVLNGFSTVGLNTFFQRKINNEHFVKLIAKNQAWAKAGVLISLGATGLGIDFHLDSSVLLAFYGILGFAFCTFLFFQAAKLENEQKSLLLNKSR